MVNALEAARKAAKKAHENLYYNGLCTIVEYGSVTDPETKRTTQKEITVIENQPCNLSFEKLVPLFKQTRQRQFRKAQSFSCHLKSK